MTHETFTFSDGTTFTKTGGTLGGGDVTWSAAFTAWKAGQPAAETAAVQDCVRVDTNGKWDDVGCSTKQFNYACQIPAGTKVCDDGWANLDGLCYKVITAEAGSEPNYATAASLCTAQGTGGKLAAPTNKDIMAEINRQNTASAQLWVGLDDSATEGTYTFSDGTSFTKTSGTYGSVDDPPVYSAAYTPWKAGQPSSALNSEGLVKFEIQDCVKVINEDWDEVDCTKPMPAYACQKPPV